MIFLADVISKRYLSTRIPPGIHYTHRKKSTTTTISTYIRTPGNVLHWGDFLTNVQNWVLSDDSNCQNVIFNTELRVSNEEGVRKFLDINVFQNLRRVTEQTGHFAGHDELPNIKG